MEDADDVSGRRPLADLIDNLGRRASAVDRQNLPTQTGCLIEDRAEDTSLDRERFPMGRTPIEPDLSDVGGFSHAKL